MLFQTFLTVFLIIVKLYELMLVRDVRIPRALSVLMTGGILGVTGAMIQGVTRNPIAEPSILGVVKGQL